MHAIVLLILVSAVSYTTSSIVPSDWMVKELVKFDNDVAETPEDVRKAFPYYISGRDYEGRPVMVVELGRWNFRKYAEVNNTDSISRQLVTMNDVIVTLGRRATVETKSVPVPRGSLSIDDIMASDASDNTESPAEGATSATVEDQEPANVTSSNVTSDTMHKFDSSPGGVTVVCDMDGFELNQLTSPSTVLFLLNGAYNLTRVGDNLESVYMINASPAGVLFFNMAKTVLRRMADRMTIFGKDKSSWMPILLKAIPQDQLPEYYGGVPNFKPVKFFG